MTSSVQQLVGWVLFVQLKHWVVRIKSTELKFLQLPSVMMLGEKEVWYIEWCLIADRTLYIFRIFSISISQQIVVWWPIESEKFWSWLFTQQSHHGQINPLKSQAVVSLEKARVWCLRSDRGSSIAKTQSEASTCNRKRQGWRHEGWLNTGKSRGFRLVLVRALWFAGSRRYHPG